MSAPIVYEGAVVRGMGGDGDDGIARENGGVSDARFEGSEGAPLFQWKKFWIAQRVPQRATLVQMVKNNGGQTVPLEKNADYLLADHARKDAPEGSYSWKFIEDSVKNGQLLNIDDYLIGSAHDEPRAMRSSQAPKGTRTPFSAEDDRLLIEYVTKKESEGIAISGNIIYKDLALKFPHHTYQSWRDRWVKRLSHLPRPNVTPVEGTPAVSNETVPGTTADDTAAVPSPSGVQATPMPSQASRASAGPSPRTARSTRAKFTEEEDKILVEYVTESQENGKKISGNKIYQDFAEDFPQHTWHSWRDRWVRTLSLKHRAKEAEEQQLAEMSRAERRADQSRKAAKARVASLPDVNESSQSEQDVPAEASNAVQNSQFDSKTNVGQSSTQQEVAVEPPSTTVQQTGDESQQRQQDGNVSEAVVDELLLDPSLAAYQPPAVQPSASPVLDKFLVGPGPIKEHFYRDLQNFVAQNTQIQSLAIWPTVHGRTFELWDLWQTVIAQKVDPVERDWQQISETLGYNWIELPTVPDEIRDTYEKYLSDFEVALISFQQAGDEDEDDTLMQSSAPAGNVESQNDASAAILNSSPPKQQKRSHEFTLSAGHALFESPRKRSRISRDSEIPITPEAAKKSSPLRNPVSAAVSPTDSKFAFLPRSSRSAKSIGSERQVATRPEEAKPQEQVPELTSLSNSRKPALEPETQDFPFDAQTQAGVLLEESQNGIHPSQQLASESDARSPTSPAGLQMPPSADNGTPTPRRPYKSPFIMDVDEDGETEVAPKTTAGNGKIPNLRAYKSPFLMDVDDGSEVQVTPKAKFGKGPNPALSALQIATVKKRTLPESFSERTLRRSFPTPSAPSPRTTTVHPSLQPSASRASTQKATAPSADVTSMPPTPPILSRSAKFDEIVEYYGSLGYPEQIARRSLDATSWNRGLAGEIMEMLKKGEALPTNWEGVWTARDDESLMLVDYAEPPKDEKEAKKRRRENKRILAKHGEQQIALRRKWLDIVARGDL